MSQQGYESGLESGTDDLNQNNSSYGATQKLGSVNAEWARADADKIWRSPSEHKRRHLALLAMQLEAAGLKVKGYHQTECLNGRRPAKTVRIRHCNCSGPCQCGWCKVRRK